MNPRFWRSDSTMPWSQLRRGSTHLLAALAVVGAVAAGVVVRSDAASGSAERSAQTVPLLRVGFPFPISSLDQARFFRGIYVASLGLETLMKIGPDGTVQPHLAQSVRHPNPFLYIYTLRKGIRFWNGNELTAEDVANALNYSRYRTSQSAFAFGASIRSIVATGRYTVRVTLKRPDATWPAIPASWAGEIFEKKFGDEHPGTMGSPGVLTMGTGPWKIESLDPTRGAELSANDRYWGGRPQIRRISIKFFANETSLALAFRAGEIDVYPGVADVQGFASTAGTKVASYPSCATAQVNMDTNTPPWNDVHLRRAVAYALNRADIIAATGDPGNKPLTTLVPPIQLRTIAPQAQVTRLMKSIPKYPLSLEKARAELAKSAYRNGLKATINTPLLTVIPAVNQVIVNQLKKIGIDLEIKTMTVAQFLSVINGADRDRLGIYFLTTGCDSPDPGVFPKTALNKPRNGSDYYPPKVDELVKAGISTNVSAKRFAAYSQLLRKLAVDVPFVMMYSRSQNLAISSKFTWQGGLTPWFYSYPWALHIKPR
jgi:peptide/nickel transport system substrate-binding protein